jgi:imidazolonepropionase-like amidohydrolase
MKAVGRYADLMAVARDPLDDVMELERPIAVLKGGQRVFGAPPEARA